MNRKIKKKIIGISAPQSELAKLFLSKYKKKFLFVPYRDNINNYFYFTKWLYKHKNINSFINFAALTNTIHCEKNKKLTLLTNFKSVVKLIKIIDQNKLRNFNYFLTLSTCHVFEKSNKKLNEGSIKKPNNFYGYSKLLLEKWILKNSLKYNFNIGIGRIFNYYTPSKKNFFINDVIKKLKSNRSTVSFVGVDTYRDYISNKDLLNALYFMLNNKLQNDYNICSGRKISLKKIVKTVNFRYKKKIMFIDTKNKNLIGDNSKLKKKGFKFNFKFNLNKIV